MKLETEAYLSKLVLSESVLDLLNGQSQRQATWLGGCMGPVEEQNVRHRFDLGDESRAQRTLRDGQFSKFLISAKCKGMKLHSFY